MKSWLRRSTISAGPSRLTLDRGAAAVEMAVVLPVLLLVLFGLIDFGRAFNEQIQLSQAAREAVRVVAMGNPSFANTRVTQAAPQLSSGVTITVDIYNSGAASPSGATTCTSNTQRAQVTVTESFSAITGLNDIARIFGAGGVTPGQIVGKAGMQCGG